MPNSSPVIAAIIPALNEGDSIAYVVRSLRQAGIPYVRVVDNGSTDDTATIAREAGADALAEPRRGYGAACWRGLQGLPTEVDWILFCDADGSDDFSRLPDFLRYALNHDFVLGARQSPQKGPTGVSLAQRIGNVIATTSIAWGWGYRYQDMGPFRLIRRSALERIRMEDRTWGWTLEMQVRAVEERLRVVEIPVQSLPRRGGRSKIGGSLIGGIRAGLRIVRVLVMLYMSRGSRSSERHSGGSVPG
ncbi:MAG: glycosyltransferase family 2 protein [Acidobacteria bacterium]|nr:glycosyltransferase family 2 protein [Acidobacteriota bacterium]